MNYSCPTGLKDCAARSPDVARAQASVFKSAPETASRHAVRALADELLLVDGIVADALLQRIVLDRAVDAIAEGGDPRRIVRLDNLRSAERPCFRQRNRRDVAAAAARSANGRPESLLRPAGPRLALLRPAWGGLHVRRAMPARPRGSVRS